MSTYEANNRNSAKKSSTAAYSLRNSTASCRARNNACFHNRQSIEELLHGNKHRVDHQISPGYSRRLTEEKENVIFNNQPDSGFSLYRAETKDHPPEPKPLICRTANTHSSLALN